MNKLLNQLLTDTASSNIMSHCWLFYSQLISCHTLGNSGSHRSTVLLEDYLQYLSSRSCLCYNTCTSQAMICPSDIGTSEIRLVLQFHTLKFIKHETLGQVDNFIKSLSVHISWRKVKYTFFGHAVLISVNL